MKNEITGVKMNCPPPVPTNLPKGLVIRITRGRGHGSKRVARKLGGDGDVTATAPPPPLLFLKKKRWIVGINQKYVDLRLNRERVK